MRIQDEKEWNDLQSDYITSKYLSAVWTYTLTLEKH